MSIRSVNIMRLIQHGEDGKISDWDLEQFMGKAEHKQDPQAEQDVEARLHAVFTLLIVSENFITVRNRVLNTLEKVFLQAMLKKYGRDTSAIAQAAGLDRSYVYRLIQKHEL